MHLTHQSVQFHYFSSLKSQCDCKTENFDQSDHITYEKVSLLKMDYEHLDMDLEHQERSMFNGMRPSRTSSKDAYSMGAFSGFKEGMFAQMATPVNRFKKATPITELLPFHDISVDAIPVGKDDAPPK